MADTRLVVYLGWLLERAQKGEIDGVAVVTTQPNPDDTKLGDTSWNGDGIERDAERVIGNLAILQARMIGRAHRCRQLAHGRLPQRGSGKEFQQRNVRRGMRSNYTV